MQKELKIILLLYFPQPGFHSFEINKILQFQLGIFEYTLLFKGFKSERFFVCKRCLLCSPRLHLFDPKYKKNNNIAK